jgi:nucleotide-binding universal stress UspA family protein
MSGTCIAVALLFLFLNGLKSGCGKKNMRVLIAYDGSECSEAALDDLVRAGLPGKGEALVVSVAEVWLPPTNSASFNGNAGMKPDPAIEALIGKHRERGKKAVVEAETLARHAQERLKRILPNWKIETYATYGSPAWEILGKAEKFLSDLIVVGSHGRGAFSRILLGSISQKVLNEARCSVRIARGKIEVDQSPERILIGFDGSDGARVAVESVARRNWSPGAEIRLVVATDPIVPTAIGRFVLPVVQWAEGEMQVEHDWIMKIAERAVGILRGANLNATVRIQTGAAKYVLVEEASVWSADTIFVGANVFGGRLDRLLLGSTSSAVASRAGCSVEVVKTGANLEKTL